MIIRNNAYKLRKIADIYVLVACKKNTVNKWLFSLNASGADIWNNCNNAISVEELINIIVKKYSDIVTKNQKIAIRNFIKYLIELGLLMEVKMDVIE